MKTAGFVPVITPSPREMGWLEVIICRWLKLNANHNCTIKHYVCIHNNHDINKKSNKILYLNKYKQMIELIRFRSRQYDV